MKLLGCHIENFGNLHDLDVQLENGLNIAIQENGWGKSTFAAFIRIMFYGFLGDGKRNAEENERLKYIPWQGGIFGGQLVFKTGDRYYRIERTFGAKHKDDRFALFDDQTNQPSSDFSSNVGEELFGMNHESFLRTVFIAQQQGPSRLTSDIHARIGGLGDDASDMNRYDDAQRRLKKKMDRLNPGRVSGEIYKKTSHLTELTALIAQGESRQNDALRISASIEKEKAQLEETNNALKKLQRQYETANRPLSQQRRLDQYRMLCRQRDALFRKADALTADLADPELDTADIDEQLDRLEQIENLRADAERYRLSSEEADDLADYTLRFRGMGRVSADDSEPDLAGSRDFSDYVDFAEDMDQRSSGGSVLAWFFILAGAAAAAGGIFMAGFMNYVNAFPVGIAGIVIFIIGCILLARSSKKRASRDERFASDSDLYEDEVRRYEKLLNKSETYSSIQHELSEETKRLRKFMTAQELNTREPARSELISLRDRVRDARKALSEAEESEIECQNYAQKYEISSEDADIFIHNDDSGISVRNTDSASDISEAIQKLTLRAQKQAEEIRRLEEQKNTALRSVDEFLQAKSQYDRENRETDELQYQYDICKKASDYLARAKETYSAQYMQPIMQAFRSCFDIMTQGHNADFQINADLEICLRSYGMLHPVSSLSEGWQDIVSFCRRLALIEAMYPDEKPFIILDDPFVNLDPEKVGGGMELLRALSADYQILYFTCSESRC